VRSGVKGGMEEVKTRGKKEGRSLCDGEDQRFRKGEKKRKGGVNTSK